MDQSTVCLIVFLLTLLLFISNKFSLPLCALISMFALMLTGCLTSEQALSCVGNPSVVIMISMFVVSAGLSRTQMITKLTDLVYKVSGGSFSKGLLGYAIVTFIIAQVVPTALLTFTICYPLVADFCRKMEVKPSKAMFTIGLVSVGALATVPVGIGATGYITTNMMFDVYGSVGYQAQMFDILIAKIPLVLMLIVYGVFFAPKFAPDKESLIAELKTDRSGRIEKKPLDPVREFLGYAIFVGVLIGLLLVDYFPFEAWQVCFGGGILTVVTGVLTHSEWAASMNLPPALLFIGTLALGTAMVSTGAGNIVSSLLTTILGNHPNGYFLGFVFFTVTFLATQLMSNVAVFQVVQPIAIMTCVAMEYNPVGPLLLCMLGAFTAFLTPMATPTIPLMMEAGGYNQKDLLKMGWIPAILAILVTVPWVMTIWPV